MATAPKPHAEPRHTEAERRRLWRAIRVNITMGGRTLAIYPAQLGPGDDAVTRKQADSPISAVLGALINGDYVAASDTLLLLWWVARRKNGEPGLSWRQVLAEYPTNDDVAAADPQLSVDLPDELEEADPEG